MAVTEVDAVPVWVAEDEPVALGDTVEEPVVDGDGDAVDDADADMVPLNDA